MVTKLFLIVTFICLIAFHLSLPAHAQDNTLSLKTAEDTALVNNKTIENVKKSITEAELNYRAVTKERLPKVSTNYTYMRTFTDFVLTGDMPSDDNPNIMIPYEMTFPQDNYSWTTWLTMPLFSHAQDLSEEIAKLGIDVAKVQLLAAKNELLQNVKVSYYTILRDEKFIEFMQQNLKSFEEHEALTSKYHVQGIVAKNSVMEAQVEKANASQDLETAQLSLTVSRATLATFMALPDRERVYSLTDTLTQKPFELTLDECFEKTRKNNPELVAFSFLKMQAEKAINLEKASYNPTLGLSGYYMIYGDNPGMTSTGGSGFPNSTLAAMLSLNWLITDWGQKADEARIKKSRLEQIKNNESLTCDRLFLKVREAYAQLKTAGRNIETARLAIDAAKENVRLANLRYREQAATSKEVIDALTGQKKAEYNFHSGLFTWNLAVAKLEMAMGLDIQAIVESQKQEKKAP
jgi:outer membrane protein